jgi:hypothetical protein
LKKVSFPAPLPQKLLKTVLVVFYIWVIDEKQKTIERVPQRVILSGKQNANAPAWSRSFA